MNTGSAADRAVTAVVIFKPKPGAEQALSAAMDRNVRASRHDPGFTSFRRLRDLDDDATLVFLEEWASHEDLMRHLGTEHVARFQQESAALLEHKEVRLLVRRTD